RCAKGRNRHRAERRFLGRRRRTAGAAARSGLMQRDLCRYRQARALAAVEESRSAPCDLKHDPEKWMAVSRLGEAQQTSRQTRPMLRQAKAARTGSAQTKS